jgi:predicted transcriptional regulator
MVKIEIVENVRKRMKQDDEYVQKVIDGKIPIDEKKAEHTIITTPELFYKMFTPEKLRLMLRIRRNKIRNIYQLAKELGRKYEAVHRDIKFLKSFGLIKIKTKDNKKIPCLVEPITIPALAGN